MSKEEELKSRSKELAEMSEKASNIEKAIQAWHDAEYYIEQALSLSNDFTSEPHGWVSSCPYDVVQELERQLGDLK